jgi:hypothetical protein
MSETEFTENYLADCRIWQKMISAQPTMEAKNHVGKEAFRALRNRTFNNSRHVIVRGDVALQIPDGTNQLEQRLWPILQYGEVQTRGWLGRLYCVPMKDDMVLTWPIYDARVLGPIEEDYITPGSSELDADRPEFRLPIDEPLRRALHFPVGLIDYAISYSR